MSLENLSYSEENISFTDTRGKSLKRIKQSIIIIFNIGQKKEIVIINTNIVNKHIVKEKNI